MPSLQKSFLPILIVFALLPSIAGSTRALKPKTENEILTEKQTSTTNSGNKNATNPIVVIQPQAGGAVGEPASKKEQDSSNQLRPEATIADVVIAGVTIVYGFVSVLTLLAIKRQTDQIAVIESPFLSVNFKPHFRDEHSPHYWLEKPWIEYWFENSGRTPATFSDAYAEFELVPQVERAPHYRERHPYPHRAIGIPPNGGKSTNGMCPHTLTPEDRINLADPETKYVWVFYGFIQYTGLPNSQNTVGFGYYIPVTSNAGGFFLIHNEKYNYRREYKTRWYHRFYKPEFLHVPLP